MKLGHYEGFLKKNSFDGSLLPGLQLMLESYSSLHPLTEALLWISELGASAKKVWNPGPKLFALNSGARHPELLLALSLPSVLSNAQVTLG